jgi:hypothetical protein
MFLIEQSTNLIVRDMALLGNAHQNKFGLQWGPVSARVTETSFAQGSSFPSGFLFHQCDGCTAQDLKVTDVFQNAVAGSFSDNLIGARIQVFTTEPLRQYVQWFFECADTAVGCTFTDVSVTSAYLVPGFEGFRSQNVQYIRPTGVNATMAMNDVGLFLIQDANLTFTPNSQFDEESFSGDNPIVNINSNIGRDFVSLGGTINNMVIVQQGYINANKDTLAGININDLNANITINGTSFTAPNYNSSPRYGQAVNSTGLNTLLSNFTVIGMPPPGKLNISILPGTGGSIVNSVAPAILGPRSASQRSGG